MYRVPLLVTIPLLVSCVLHAQGALVLEPLPLTFTQPTDILSDGFNDEIIYVVEKGGTINQVDLVAGTATIVLDLTGMVDDKSEGGALGAAFHPSYPDSNYLYVNYTGPGRNGSSLTTYISRFTLDNAGIVVDPSEFNLLTLPQPAGNHNAGDLAFGPDGYLYVPLGDGGGSNDQFENAQDPGTMLGKLLRINVDTAVGGMNYAIPADNPFVGSTDTLSEIWALGLRNPWRISFDRETGDLWIADVGQNEREEVNKVPAASAGGMNFGWNCREGLIATSFAVDRCDGAIAYTDPLFDYPHNGNDGINGGSVTGGFVYRGPDAGLYGYYVFADFVQPRIFLYDSTSTDVLDVVYNDLPAKNVSTFGEGNDGTLYVADFSGEVYELTSDSGLPVRERPAAVLTLGVFPNPVHDQLTLEFPGEVHGAVRVALHDAQGRRVGEWRDQRVVSGHLALNLPELPAGAYLLTATTERQRYRSQVTVQ
ncbi:PQQ-dependent sugar dehydrogenase [Lewinella sp. IMCC34183]|uniref:PQQ-dependent sugar dehydrogenase n=1 Tax=Lewinella sp. IMCC34183 TaxID=2248762 RepID=UPI000E26EFD3|nr:PQQ-dependent sugar dehydrogenase [Lewinella sp. IMCC34183]